MDSEEEVLTQLTQPTDSSQPDPRRMGRNNSGLSDEDVGDVVVVLHPTTPAAFELVAQTARRTPQHVLQRVYRNRPSSATQSTTLDEQETFILDTRKSSRGLDLAFRFSSKLVKPHLGFGFGRNPHMCDILVASDVHKRVSNLHFIIHPNESGVVMLQDMSTNGTMVDDFLLKSKSENRTRMLTNGTTIQILSPSPEEALKFIVRIPSRQGHIEDFERNFEAYMERQADAQVRYNREHGIEEAPKPRDGRSGNAAIKAPLVHNTFGMHWNGGDTYNVVGTVGKGAFASVYQLATKIDGKLYAAKELEKRRFMKNGILDRKLENEMNIMQAIDHRSIVQYHEYKDVENHLYIIMEFVPCGDLQQHLGEYGPLKEHTAKQMSLQVLDALDYLHIKKITHRDIKPDNILIASRDPDDFIIKLSDFGLSKVVQDNDTFLKTFCGTLLYCAPEVFPHYDSHVGKGVKRPRKAPPQQKHRSYSQAVDIWSFGAVLWFSLCVKPPFEGVADNTGRGMFDKIMMTPLNAADLAMQGVSDEAVALCVSMLNTDPQERPSPADCLRNPWFADHNPLIRSQLLANGLDDIVEEVENEKEAVGEPNVAALSLNERSSSQYSEVSLNDSDLNFFDPRQSKRFKANDYQGDEDWDLVDSSPEGVFDTIPIMHDTASPPSATKPKAPKLFGEISHSDLQSPAFGQRVNHATGQEMPSVDSDEQYSDHSQHAQPKSAPRSGSSPSLQGAEGMVRDMQMQSAFPSESGAVGEQNQAGTPPSFGSLGQSDTSGNIAIANMLDETPRPAQQERFSRRIELGWPASFFYEPNDPTTHNIEYASKVSGHDFSTDPLLRRKDSLPTTMSNSNRSENSQEAPSMPLLEVADSESVTQSRAPPPSNTVFGRLISTDDSFAEIVIELDRRLNYWGRKGENTHVYEDKADTRVPKTAFGVFFYAPDSDDIESDDDLRHMPGLYSGILTYARNGMKINGVQLNAKDSATGKGWWGCLQTGDEIEVWSTPDKGCLKFRAEIYYGEGRKKRSKNGPKFRIEEVDAPLPQIEPGKLPKHRKAKPVVQELQAVGGAEAEDEEDLYS